MNLTKAQRAQLQELANRTKNSPKSRRFVRVAPEDGDDSDVGLIVDLENPEGTRQRIDTPNQYFTVDNISTYKLDTEQPIIGVPTDGEFGEMVTLQPAGRYAKVFQLQHHDFSNLTFRAYWYEIERSIEMNTGIITNADSRGRRFRVSTNTEWKTLLQCSEPMMIAFRTECLRHGSLAKFETRGDTFWICNPLYCWNGNLIPIPILQLFDGKTKIC